MGVSRLLRRGPPVDTTLAAIIADTIDGDPVDDGLLVHVGDMHAAEIVH
jgi:hypothetical protein